MDCDGGFEGVSEGKKRETKGRFRINCEGGGLL